MQTWDKVQSLVAILKQFAANLYKLAEVRCLQNCAGQSLALAHIKFQRVWVYVYAATTVHTHTYVRTYNDAVTMHEITSPALSRHTTCAHYTTHCVWLPLPLPLATLLTNAEVCVDACIACGACQVLVLSVRYVLVGACIAVLLCQSKVNDVD